MGKREKVLIRGTALRPRLVVYRSHQHIYVQAIDDSCGHTFLACSTQELEIKKQVDFNTSNIKAALLVGEAIGVRLAQNNITKVVFDRNQRPYHGRIAAVAEGIRKTGIHV
jgi:large subunit ribosomal protein L18